LVALLLSVGGQWSLPLAAWMADISVNGVPTLYRRVGDVFAWSCVVVALGLCVTGLARRGVLEWAVIDPGSAHFSRFDELRSHQPGFVYLNPDQHFLEGMRIAAAHRVRRIFLYNRDGERDG
jgi:hypothetical protein